MDVFAVGHATGKRAANKSFNRFEAVTKGGIAILFLKFDVRIPVD